MRVPVRVLRSAGFLLFALVVLEPIAAEAQVRVAVLPFSGNQANRARSAMFQNLQEQGGIQLVSMEEVDGALAAIGIRRPRADSDFVQLAERLQAGALVVGRVSRRRRRSSVTVQVRNGGDGQVAGSATWSGRRNSAVLGPRRDGFERLAEAILGGRAPAAETPTGSGYQVSQDSGRPWYAQDEPEPEEPPQERRPSFLGDADEDYDDDEYDGDYEEDDEDDDDYEDDEDDESASQRQDFLVIGVLGGTLHRSLATTAIVNSPSGGGPSTVPETRTYQSGGIGHMELGLGVEFYPGAIGEEQGWPFLGLIGHFRHSFFLNSQSCPEGQPTCGAADKLQLDTRQLELYVGARARYRFGPERRSPQIWADVGYGLFNFTFNKEQLIEFPRSSIIPPISYSFIHLGAGVSYGLVPTYLTVGVRGAYRPGLGVGTDALAVWGTKTGAPSGFQLGADVTVEIPEIREGVFVRASFEYFQFSTLFQGQTACAFPGCGENDPWEQWPSEGDRENVTGGIQSPVVDEYFRLGLTIGYALR
ncbi:MAG: hypothetical protein AAGF12_21335 [Myxococcota bacterium]